MTILVNYFSMFNIQADYAIDKETLRKQYMIMQKKYHPDLSTDAQDQIKKIHKTSMINEGYKILVDDFSRAEHLLNIQSIYLNTQEAKSILSIEELDDILEKYTHIHDSDSSKIKNEITKIQNDLAHITNQLKLAFHEQDIQQAFYLTVQMKFLKNLSNEANKQLHICSS